MADGLKDGTSHTALLQVSASAGSEFRFFGGTVTLGIPTNGKVVDDGTTLDDRNPAIGYAPSTGALAWDHTGTGRTLYNTTLTFNCNYGATVLATYAFTGAGGVVLLGNVWQDSHAFSVTLDDATTNLDATSSWQDGQTVLFARGGLDPAVQHTVSLRDFSADDTTCNQGKYCCTGLDAITLLKPGTACVQPLPLPLSSFTLPQRSAARDDLERERGRVRHDARRPRVGVQVERGRHRGRRRRRARGTRAPRPARVVRPAPPAPRGRRVRAPAARGQRGARG